MAILYEFDSNINSSTIYLPTYKLALTVCVLLFTLYGVLGLFDMNKNVYSMTIVELSTLTNGSYIYAYLFGYIIFIIRIIVNLLTLYVFILIIMISFSTIWFIIKDDEKKKWIENTSDIIWSISVYILGILLNPQFYFIFIIFIPAFIWIILVLYTRFIDIKTIKLENEPDRINIMTSHHNILIFMMLVFFFLGICAFIFNWLLLHH